MTKVVPDGRDWRPHRTSDNLAIRREVDGRLGAAAHAIALVTPRWEKLTKDERANFHRILANALVVLLVSRREMAARPRMATVRKNIGALLGTVKAARSAAEDLDERSRMLLGSGAVFELHGRLGEAESWLVQQAANLPDADKRQSAEPAMLDVLGRLGEAYRLASGRKPAVSKKRIASGFVEFVTVLLAAVGVHLSRPKLEKAAGQAVRNRARRPAFSFPSWRRD